MRCKKNVPYAARRKQTCIKNNIWFYKKECCTRENRAALFLSVGMVEKAFNAIYTEDILQILVYINRKRRKRT